MLSPLLLSLVQAKPVLVKLQVQAVVGASETRPRQTTGASYVCALVPLAKVGTDSKTKRAVRRTVRLRWYLPLHSYLIPFPLFGIVFVLCPGRVNVSMITMRLDDWSRTPPFGGIRHPKRRCGAVMWYAGTVMLCAGVPGGGEGSYQGDSVVSFSIAKAVGRSGSMRRFV
jgi:hypothetical protein